MRSPTEYYIKYLLSDPRKTISLILEYLVRDGIRVDIDYLESLRVGLRFPTNYSPLDRTHKPTENFLKRERIWGLWHPTTAVHEAFDIYQTPGVREVVCSCILSGFTAVAIVRILLERKGISVLPESIIEFRHYFWNTDLLTTSELTALFSDDKGFPVESNYLVSLKALKNHPAGAHLALYKLGLIPQELKELDMLRVVRDMAYMNICETDTVRQGRSKSEMLRNYAVVLRDAIHDMREIQQMSEDVLEEFRATVRLSPEVKEPPLLAEVIETKEYVDAEAD